MTLQTSTREPRRACMVTVVHQALDVRIFHKQARTLAENGWEVTLVAPSAPREQEVEGIRILGLPPAPRWRRPLNWLRAFRAAMGTGADVYHIHDPELLLIVPLLRLWTRRPVIYDAHEVLVENVLLKEWLPGPLRPVLGRLAGLAESTLMRWTAAMICANPPQVGLYGRAPGGQPVLVANYAEVDRQWTVGKSDRRPVVAFVGGVTEANGIRVLLEAFLQVRQAVPQAELWLVGPVDTAAFETEITSWVTEHEAAPYVRVFGRVPFPRVAEILNEAAVGIVTYLPVGDYSKCLPTKLFEYMAAGIPCVCSSIPLWADIVREAGCGLIVDPADPGAVGQAICELLRDRERAQEMGARGRQAFLAKYNWQHEGEKLLALYARLCPAVQKTPMKG